MEPGPSGAIRVEPWTVGSVFGHSSRDLRRGVADDGCRTGYFVFWCAGSRWLFGAGVSTRCSGLRKTQEVLGGRDVAEAPAGGSSMGLQLLVACQATPIPDGNDGVKICFW